MADNKKIAGEDDGDAVSKSLFGNSMALLTSDAANTRKISYLKGAI
jgi:hypothetical protein